MAKNKFLIVIGGPTASGKTTFSIEVAKHFNCPIISADSRQYYREMAIGTAKPTREELDQAPHYFIDHLSITDPYTVGDFEREASALLEELYEKHQVVLLTGGSGLFINALCQGLDEFPEVPNTLRKALQEWYEKNGIEALQETVKDIDPTYYNFVDQSNPHRLLRALEVYKVSGKPFSTFRKAQSKPRSFVPIYLWMTHSRPLLYDRINRRVDIMVEMGLEEEAKRLLPHRALTALQTVGYREWFDHFDGKIDRETAITQIKQNTRRYAKRQTTWSRRDGFWKHLVPLWNRPNHQYIESALAGQWSWEQTKENSLSDQFSCFNLTLKSFQTVLYEVIIFQRGKDVFIVDKNDESPIQAMFWEEVSLRYIDQNITFISSKVPAFDLKPLHLQPVDHIVLPKQIKNQHAFENHFEVFVKTQ